MLINNTLIKQACLHLDKQIGKNWENKINLKTLDIAHSTKCIIGQLFNNYIKGLLQLKLHFNKKYTHLLPAFAYSRNSSTKAWRKEIKKERKKEWDNILTMLVLFFKYAKNLHSLLHLSYHNTYSIYL